MKNNSGLLGKFDLLDWWLSEFSVDTRQYLLNEYSDTELISAKLLIENVETSMSATHFLWGFASQFLAKTKDQEIGLKILSKAEQVGHSEQDFIYLHFVYQTYINFYYKNRNDDSLALNQATQYCYKQIEIASLVAQAMRKEYGRNSALPAHLGYKQLSIILDKQKKFDEAILICEQAQKQKWSGDWEKRIARYQIKKSKE